MAKTVYPLPPGTDQDAFAASIMNLAYPNPLFMAGAVPWKNVLKALPQKQTAPAIPPELLERLLKQ